MLHVKAGDTGVSSFDSRYHITVENNGESYLAFYAPDNSFAGVRFHDTTGTEGYIDYYFNTDEMHYNSSAIHKWTANGSERLRIDSSGRLLLGTTTEGEASADDLTIAGSGNQGITIRSGTSSSGNLFFSDGTSGNSEIRGYVQYLHSNNALLFGTNAGERLRIDSSGHMSLGGGATPSSTNGGIGLKFGIKSSANNILIGETTSSSHNGLILESRLTGRSGGARASQINIGQDGTGGRIVFSTAPGSADVTERLRIDRNGDLGLGIAAVPQDSGAKTLHIHHPDTSGSTARAGLRLTTGISGSAASNGGFLGLDYSNNLYLYNQENGTLRIGTNAAEKVRIHSNGVYFYGGDNVFYGATSLSLIHI